MSAPPLATVLVLSEDKPPKGVETVKALLRHMLHQVDPAADTARIELEPLPDSKASSVVTANVWKSAKGTATAGVVDLVQRIARHLVTDGGVVVHHVDGDRVWSERETSENVAAYLNVIVRGVRRQVSIWTEKRKRGSEVDARMNRLVLLVPCWSIEAWLFQNEAEAKLHCSSPQHPCGERLKTWAADRTLLDEEATPKALLCFESSHNLALAGPLFPRDEVQAAGKSYATAVNALKACGPLVDALARSRA